MDIVNESFSKTMLHILKHPKQQIINDFLKTSLYSGWANFHGLWVFTIQCHAFTMPQPRGLFSKLSAHE